ncbi:hypothetical protein E1288_14370 [Saccharopolyspora elongata]|uniref:Uncharacterized protein n=1 Tax=Saccharopolyspora elongata TaxID=2530387 RepID=A0A4V2YMT7_9PSEU|nr:hypothetical protein E1288_14370 [Saccharopolyspora elongata]
MSVVRNVIIVGSGPAGYTVEVYPPPGAGKPGTGGFSGAGLCLGGYCVAAFCGVFCFSSPSFMPFVSGRSQNVISVITPRQIA